MTMKYNDQFKMDVAIEVIQSKKSVSVVAKQYGIHCDCGFILPVYVVSLSIQYHT